MAGPTPVSALIHAATMVTAGVYLIARTHVLFTLAPAVLTLVAVIGTLTLLMAGFAALVQTDIKRVLAVFHHQPDRLHVPGPRGRGLVGGAVPLHDPRLLQGAPVPGGGRGHHVPSPRAGHVPNGRPPPADAVHLLVLPHRQRGVGGHTVGLRRVSTART